MDIAPDVARQEFRRLVSVEGDCVDLFRAALLVAAAGDCPTDEEACVSRITELARDAEMQRTGDDAAATLAAVRVALFDRAGFTGNDENYYDPRNSFLPEVLRRRTGIPITLSLVVREVASRLGLRLDGVNFPGHFLLQAQIDNHPVLLDAFHSLREVTEEGQRELLTRLMGPGVEPRAPFRAIATERTILARMLNNLRLVYTQREEYLLAARFGELLAQTEPGVPGHIRDLGLLQAQAGHLPDAIRSLRRYLTLAEHAPDAQAIRTEMQRIFDYLVRLN